MSLYNCKSDPNPPNGFRITKFGADLNPESSYSVTNATCTCPAGVRPTCRHRKMLGAFLKSRHIDDEWFYHFEEDCWIGPAEHLTATEIEARDPDPGGHMAKAEAAILEPIVDKVAELVQSAKLWRRI